MLLLALEPEAASLFCKNELGLSIIPVGCKYLVLDLGGNEDLYIYTIYLFHYFTEINTLYIVLKVT